MYQCNIFIGSGGGHHLLQHAFELRRQVFVEQLGWPLTVDAAGREVDEFDHEGTRYVVLSRHGQVMATTRLLPSDGPCLLYDVYGWTVTEPSERGRHVWEGSRMAVRPDLDAAQSRYWAAAVLFEAGKDAAPQGVTRFVTLSDPVLERVLARAGAAPRRLGPVAVDSHGFKTLPLEIDCDEVTISNLYHQGMVPYAGRVAAREAA